jgi:hypothetical protein
VDIVVYTGRAVPSRNQILVLVLALFLVEVVSCLFQFSSIFFLSLQ